METEQKRDVLSAKSHEEILSLLKELDTLEKRVKNLPPPSDASNDSDAVLHPMEILEPVVKSIEEPKPKQSIDRSYRKTPKKHSHESLIDLYKKQRADEKKSKPELYSHSEEQIPPPVPLVEPEVPRQTKRRKQKEKPIHSTFKLYITEEGTLAGLDIKKPKPPKAQKSVTGDQPQDAQEPGFKGKLKRVAKKITKRGESGAGIGSKIKGIGKRRPKEKK